MGTDERIPYPRDPEGDMVDPQKRAINTYAQQSPMGCKYYDASTTFTSITNNTSTTLPFLGTTLSNLYGYDPYQMLDLANETITIPQPGIWDVDIELTWSGTPTVVGDFIFGQFGQGSFTCNANEELTDWKYVSANNQGVKLHITGQLFANATILGSGRTYRIRVLQVNGAAGNRSAKIVTCNLWLKSANIPAKF